MTQFYNAYWKHAQTIIDTYKGECPLPYFLKQYFAQNKNCGSKDRKAIHKIVYSFYRIGFIVYNKSLQQQIAIAFFVLYNDENVFIEQHFPMLLNSNKYNVEEKLIVLEKSFLKIEWLKSIPFLDYLSPQISPLAYGLSFFQEPVFYLMLIKNEFEIEKILKHHSVFYTKISPKSFAFLSNQNVSILLKNHNADYVIQDYSCQRLLDYMPLYGHEKIWDCCSGSGGKSILIKLTYHKTKIWNSDIRANTLLNLKQRFKQYNIQSEGVFEYNASTNIPTSNMPLMDVVLADVPCTGSGTWHSSPEQRRFFNTKEIEKFVQKQRSIIANILPKLKQDGLLIYITCSVFEAENEAQVNFFIANYNLQLVLNEYINNEKKYNADTIYISVLRQNNP